MSSAGSKQIFFSNTNNAFGAKREVLPKFNRINKRRSGQNQYETNKNFAKRIHNGHADVVDKAHIFNESSGLKGPRYESNHETGFNYPRPTFASTHSNAKPMFDEKYAQEKFAGKPFRNRKCFSKMKIDRRTRKGGDNSEGHNNIASRKPTKPKAFMNVPPDVIQDKDECSHDKAELLVAAIATNGNGVKCQEMVQSSRSCFTFEMISEMNQSDTVLSNSKSLMEYRKPSVDQLNPEPILLPINKDFIADYSNEPTIEFEKPINELGELSSILCISEKIEIQGVLDMNSQKPEETVRETEEHMIPSEKSKALDVEICSANDEDEETVLLDAIATEKRHKEEKEMMETIKFSWSPLNICQMIEDQINVNGGMSLGKRMFWKLVISMPPEGSILNCDQDRLTKWLARKFKVADEQLPENGTDLSLAHSQRMTATNGRGLLDLCIRSTKDISFDPMTMQGASSMIFFIRDQKDTCSVHQLLEIESERLSAFLGSRPSLPAPSLTIIALKNPNCTTDYISECLRLSSYVEKELIESFHVVTCHDVWHKETSIQLKECIKFMLQRLPPSPPLRTQTVSKFFQEYLSKFLFIPVENNSHRSHYNYVKELSFLIDAYNKVASWLISKVTDSSELGSISWPPTEFCFKDKDLPPPLWNFNARFQALELFLRERILLPSFPITSDRTWDEACQTLNKYITNITDDSPSSWNLISNVYKILEKAKSQIKPWKRPRFAKASSQLSSSIVPRTSIAIALIDFKLSQLHGIKDLNFDRLLTVSYFQDLIAEADVPTLVYSPLTTPEKDSQSCVCENLNVTHSITKDDLNVLFDKVTAEKAANELFLKYLEDAQNYKEEVLDIEPKFKKARCH